MRETAEKVAALELSDHWSMYTAAGNRSLRNKADRFRQRVVAALTDDERYPTDRIRKAAKRFVAQWEKMDQNKKYREAGDTAVREEVWVWFVRVLQLAGMSPSTIDELWDEARDEYYFASQKAGAK